MTAEVLWLFPGGSKPHVRHETPRVYHVLGLDIAPTLLATADEVIE
jgi:hypothetical protein